MGACPGLAPPARTNPFPETLMLPLAETWALSWLITQGTPPGTTPRTTFRFSTQAVGQPVTDTRGMTPIPPLNVKTGLFDLLLEFWAAAGPAIADMSKAPAATATNTLANASHLFTIFI